MLIFILLSRIGPLIISAYLIASTEAALGGIVLLILHIINNTQSYDEELGRLEHKLDTVACATIDDLTHSENYALLHRSAWGHQYPMKINADLASLAKKRSDYLLVVNLLLGFGWYCLFALWIYKIA